MHILSIVQCLGVVATANIIPPIARILFGEKLKFPLDGGVICGDGRPLLGPSKTLRGAVLAILGGAFVSHLIGLGASCLLIDLVGVR